MKIEEQESLHKIYFTAVIIPSVYQTSQELYMKTLNAEVCILEAIKQSLIHHDSHEYESRYYYGVKLIFNEHHGCQRAT